MIPDVGAVPGVDPKVVEIGNLLYRDEKRTARAMNE
jgi:hypothetical protein